ncbi:mersacidin/lichenicidin family type 2 lantibiotic [Amycolatopsis sp. 195334CR]|uniref:mersacidin/lichenicidin family type 2 lantibiotic n=1 Tax=Amycolatopsis sp. 195334CR TaxID=2814588 RepID=UPI001A90C3B7|nr:mersacidin/lichenicidin family type 2 lantibiotic [Amycolatopsis sp. 195334CR]MBN6033673.1 mersacidin/lichenicidin family type 2 lantibiotic [Amycolatopsis sp. 195334CR]
MHDLVRTWKDPEYRNSLTAIPAHPAGQAELTKMELADATAAVGGTSTVGLLCATLITMRPWPCSFAVPHQER